MDETTPQSEYIVRVQSWELGAPPPTALANILRTQWPCSPGTTATGEEACSVLCTGPTDWLVIRDGQQSVPTIENLDAALRGSSYRATDVSAALLRLRIEGNASIQVLGKGCFLDLRLAEFAVTRVARTRLAGIPVVVWRRDTSIYECILTRSYGEYFRAWLTDAALEFGVVG